MHIKTLFIILTLFSLNRVHAQDNYALTIHFSGSFNESKINFNNSYYRVNSDSLQFTSVKFYISNIKLINNKKPVFAEQNSFHLIDLAFDSSANLTLQVPENIAFNEIKFNIGIDSLTNVSGAMGGDLDPTKGMYWTWQNGYINAKIEGKSNLCKTRHNDFEFHIGGYNHPYNSLQTKTLMIEDKKNINIVLEMEKMFQEINLTTQNKFMSPSADVVKLAILFSNTFTIAK